MTEAPTADYFDYTHEKWSWANKIANLEPMEARLYGLLPRRGAIALLRVGCRTVGDAALLTEQKLLEQRNCGNNTVADIRKVLHLAEVDLIDATSKTDPKSGYFGEYPSVPPELQ